MIKSDRRDAYNVFKILKRLIFQINAVCFEFFQDSIEYKVFMVSTKILISTTIFNSISEGSCDTEELKIQMCIAGINYILKLVQSNN